MKHKLIIIALIALVTLAGCKKTTTTTDDTSTVAVLNTVQAGDYQTLDPFTVSPTRIDHGLYLGKLDLFNVDERLLNYSKKVFSVDNYYLTEGTVIDRSTYRMLTSIPSSAADGVNSLNKVEDGKTYYLDAKKTISMTNPVFVDDIVEKNFYRKSDKTTLAGISIALVMRKQQTIDSSTGATANFDDSVLYQYGQLAANQLNNYIRSNLADKTGDVPIFITIYAASADNEYLPGRTLGSSTYQSNGGNEFTAINEQWYMFSSTAADTAMPGISSQFVYVKNAVQNYLSTETLGFVAKGLSIDGSLSRLDIEITAGFKSYTEVSGVAQKVNSLLTNFGDYSYPISISIENYGTVVMTMKSANSKATTQINWVN